MKCPIDGTDLQMAERKNVEIDYCPKCRGVWLDKGELDKIIELSMGEQEQLQQGQVANDPYYSPQYQGGGHHGSKGYYGKKHKGLLGELFDF